MPNHDDSYDPYAARARRSERLIERMDLFRKAMREAAQSEMSNDWDEADYDRKLRDLLKVGRHDTE